MIVLNDRYSTPPVYIIYIYSVSHLLQGIYLGVNHTNKKVCTGLKF